MIGASDSMDRVPQTNRDSGSHDGADREWQCRGKHLARNEVVLGMGFIRDVRHAWTKLHGKHGRIELRGLRIRSHANIPSISLLSVRSYSPGGAVRQHLADLLVH